MNIINEKITLPNGKEISIETGKLAKQADGSVVVRMGDTMILATAVATAWYRRAHIDIMYGRRMQRRGKRCYGPIQPAFSPTPTSI